MALEQEHRNTGSEWRIQRSCFPAYAQEPYGHRCLFWRSHPRDLHSRISFYQVATTTRYGRRLNNIGLISTTGNTGRPNSTRNRRSIHWPSQSLARWALRNSCPGHGRTLRASLAGPASAQRRQGRLSRRARLHGRSSSPMGRNRAVIERHKLAEASYNAGLGSIIKAQIACSGAVLWSDILSCLPQVTGTNSAQTITYVSRIERWRTVLGK